MENGLACENTRTTGLDYQLERFHSFSVDHLPCTAHYIWAFQRLAHSLTGGSHETGYCQSAYLLQVVSFGLLEALYSLWAVGAWDCGPIVCGTLSTNLITKLLQYGTWAATWDLTLRVHQWIVQWISKWEMGKCSLANSLPCNVLGYCNHLLCELMLENMFQMWINIVFLTGPTRPIP
jgi:hypothetical protein